MKRLVIAFSIVILLAMFSPGFSIFAQPAHVPHENPLAARSSPDSTALLQSYGNIFNLAAARQYQNAQSLLQELNQTNTPDEIRDTIDSYKALSRQLFDTLNNAESLLESASTLFADNQPGEAKAILDDAEVNIQNAQFMLEDIKVVTTTVADSLGIFTTSATSPIKQAYYYLEDSLNRLEQLTGELNLLRQRLELNPQTRIKTSFYHSTFLEVSAPETAYPGLPVTISGQLSSTGGNAARTVKVSLDNIQLAEETIRGKFSLEITPPPQTSTGKHSLTVAATPQGRYSGASKRLSIDISRIPLQTDIQVPKIILVPKPIQVSGKVFHNLTPDHKLLSDPNQSSSAIRYIYTFHDNVDRTIKVLLDDAQLVEKNISHQFCLEIITPPQTSSDQHSLKVVVTPQEHFPGTSKRPVINISRIPPQAGILISVQDARVNLDFERPSPATKTATDGSFTASVDTPFDLSLAGFQELTITITPAEPWQAPLEIKRWVFTFNPANTGLMLVAFLTLGLLVYKRVRVKIPGQREETDVPTPRAKELPAAIPPPKPEYEFTGTRGKILSAYLSGLDSIEKRAGISMAAHATLREFLKMATPELPATIKPFAELTAIAEKALYSAHSLGKNMAARAEQLATTIREEPHDEPA